MLPSSMPASSSGAGTSRSERVALPISPFISRPMTPPSTYPTPTPTPAASERLTQAWRGS